MNTKSRIPELHNLSSGDMSNWYRRMAEANLLFHPDDAPEEIVLISDGAPAFNKAECYELNNIMSKLFKQHGDQVYEAAYPHFMKTLEPLAIG